MTMLDASSISINTDLSPAPLFSHAGIELLITNGIPPRAKKCLDILRWANQSRKGTNKVRIVCSGFCGSTWKIANFSSVTILFCIQNSVTDKKTAQLPFQPSLFFMEQIIYIENYVRRDAEKYLDYRVCDYFKNAADLRPLVRRLDRKGLKTLRDLIQVDRRLLENSFNISHDDVNKIESCLRPINLSLGMRILQNNI